MTRIEKLRAIAQSAPGAAGMTVPVSPAAVVAVDIRSLPRFNPTLFSARPDVIADLNQIIGRMNTYMSQGSGGAITFNTVWQTPSENGSKFPDTVRYLLTISRWVYQATTMQAPAYSVDGLRKFASDFINTVSSFPFSEIGAPAMKAELVRLGNTMAAKLGGR